MESTYYICIDGVDADQHAGSLAGALPARER
jgi:hypothetical protein